MVSRCCIKNYFSVKEKLLIICLCFYVNNWFIEYTLDEHTYSQSQGLINRFTMVLFLLYLHISVFILK